MRKYKKNFFISILLVFMFLMSSTCVYAASDMLTGNEPRINSTKQYNSPREVRMTGSPRGRLISSVEVDLTDKGGGTVEVYADLLCHEPMKKLRIWLYLEKQIGEEEWETVQYEQFSWEKKDYPDKDLTMAMVSYDIPNLERGQNYRMRAIFGANALTSSLSEAWTINTTVLYVE